MTNPHGHCDMQCAISPDFHQWLYLLHDAGRRGTTPARMLSIASKAIPYQLVLFDGSHALVAYEANGLQIPPSMQAVLEHGFAMHVSTEHQKAYRQRAREHPAGFELEFDGDEEAVPLWVRPIRALSGESYYLHVMGMRADDQETRILVDELAYELASVLSYRTGLPTQTHNDLVQALVTRRHTTSEIVQREDFSGWKREPRYQAIRILATRSYVPVPQWHRHANAVSGLFLNAHVSIMDDGLTLLVFGNGQDIVLPGADPLDRHLANNGLIAGASDWHDSLEHAPDAYRQACEAVAMGYSALAKHKTLEPQPDGPLSISPLASLSSRHACLFTYDECRFPLLLAQVQTYAQTADIVPQSLRTLERHDREHGTTYIPTLLAYLRNLMSKAPTCHELGIHRTTLDYRLERIAELAGIDLADTRERNWLLVLSLMANTAAEMFACADKP